MKYENNVITPTSVGGPDYYSELQKSIDFWDRYYEEHTPSWARPKRKVKITRTYTETIEYEE